MKAHFEIDFGFIFHFPFQTAGIMMQIQTKAKNKVKKN